MNYAGTHTTDGKHSQLTAFKVITMMMGKCYPIICTKSYSHILLSLSFHLIIIGRQHVIFCFHDVLDPFEDWR